MVYARGLDLKCTENNSFAGGFVHLKLRRQWKEDYDYLEVEESKTRIRLQDSK